MRKIISFAVIAIIFAACSGSGAVKDFTPEELAAFDKNDYIPSEKADKAPEIDGGLAELGEKLYLTDEAEDAGVSGNVVVKAYITEEGYVINTEVLNGLGYGLDEITTNAIKSTKFVPGRVNGKPVKTELVLPIGFNNDVASPNREEERDYFRAYFGDRSYTDNYTLPEPVGGIASITKNIVYPVSAQQAGVEGRVYVSADISAEGDVLSVRVLKGIGAGCDEAAKKAVKKTKFTPGTVDGKPVSCNVAIPILFGLANDRHVLTGNDQDEYSANFDEKPYPREGMYELESRLRRRLNSNRYSNYQTNVSVKVYVNEHGIVKKAEVRGAEGNQEDKIVSEVRRTIFVPAKRNGKKVKSISTINLTIR